MGKRNGRKTGRPLENDKPVRIIETGEVYPNYICAAEAINGNRSNVYLCLKGTRPTHLGYSFEFVENDKEAT